MERLTERTAVGILVKEGYGENALRTLYSCYGEKSNPHYTNCDEGYCAIEKLAEYEDAEEQGMYIKLPEKVEETEYRECVHTRTKCHHENCKCSECPLTELFCDEFYTAIDRCYEDAYASGCLAGIELRKAEAEAEAKLKEMEGSHDD